VLPHLRGPLWDEDRNTQSLQEYCGFFSTMADVDYSRRNKVPRLITDNEKAKLEEYIDSIIYSARSVTPKIASFACVKLTIA
jgi:hypothetical protein